MADHTAELQNLYVAYFNRPADPKGLEYWSNVLDKNPAGIAAIAPAFAASAEYQLGFAGKTSAQSVDAVYHHLFGRAAEPAGSAYWSALLDKGAITIDGVVTAIAHGAQTTDLYAYNAKVTVATAFTKAIDTPEEVMAYSGAITNAFIGDYLAKVVDESSFKAAVDPQAIDHLIDVLLTRVVLIGPVVNNFGESALMFN